jgi:hypothetical protein
MFQVSSNATKNRLYITLAGHMESSERQEAMRAIMAEAGKLGPGFDIITDITELHATDQAGFKDFLRAKSTLKLKGVGHIIRVTRIPLSRIQLERISEAAGYHSDHATSVADADQQLDALHAPATAAP